MTSLFRKLFSRKSQRRRTVPIESPSDTIDAGHKGGSSSGGNSGGDYIAEQENNHNIHHTADANSSSSSSSGNSGQLPAVVGVFHDLENVSFPSKSNDATVAELVRNLTRSITDAVQCSQEVQIKAFKCYFDSIQTSDAMRRALYSSGIETIDISHLENKDKDAVDKVMLVDTLFFFADHLLHLDSSKVHKVVVLITGDRDFSVAAQRLAHRSVKVIVVLRNRQHPVHASLTAGVHHILYLDDLVTAPRKEKKKKSVKSSTAPNISKSPPRAEANASATILVSPARKTKTSSYHSDTPAPDIIEVIKKHLVAAPTGSILCSQLGTSLRNENGIVVSGLVSFLNSHESIFYVQGTNGSETVSLKSSASKSRLSSSSRKLDEVPPQQPGVRNSLTRDSVRETLVNNGGRMTITDLNLQLIRRGIQPKGLGSFLKSHPDLFQVERKEEKGAEPFVTYVPVTKNIGTGEDNDIPHAVSTRTPEERIQAILDILSNAPTVWVHLNTLGISLSERGFSKMKPKISDFIRGYPNEIALRGEGIRVEAALIKRMGDEQLRLDDVTDTVSSSI